MNRKITLAFDERRPIYVPSRAIFLVKAVMIAVSCYFVDLVSAAPPEGNAIKFRPGRINFFNQIQSTTPEVLTIRAFATMAMWTGSYCVLQCIYNMLSIIAVGSGLSPVKSWRPLFGFLLEAYTVRRF